MANVNFRGPSVALGMLLDGTWDPDDGPDMEYQGSGILDHRQTPANKDAAAPQRYIGFFNNPYCVLADNVPQTSTSATIAAAANVVSGVAMTLTSAQANGATANIPSVAVGIPVVPVGSSTPVTTLAFDFGFTTGTTTSGSATVTVPDSTVFQPGQWIYIGGAGNAGKTAPLSAIVGTLASATTITLVNSVGATQTALASVTNAPIGGGRAPSAGYSAPGSTPLEHWPYLAAGATWMFNPRETLARGVAILGTVGGSGGTFLVRGYDIYHNAMSEVITVGAGAVTGYGKKAFKYILSVTPQFTNAFNYTVTASDVFGFHWRSDLWEYTDVFYNGTFTSTSVGWLAADTTNPATTTTGDTRGTVQVSTAGGGTQITGGAATNNVRRLTIMANATVQQLTFSNPTNTVPWFGRAQA